MEIVFSVKQHVRIALLIYVELTPDALPLNCSQATHCVLFGHFQPNTVNINTSVYFHRVLARSVVVVGGGGDIRVINCVVFPHNQACTKGLTILSDLIKLK